MVLQQCSLEVTLLCPVFLSRGYTLYYDAYTLLTALQPDTACDTRVVDRGIPCSNKQFPVSNLRNMGHEDLNPAYPSAREGVSALNYYSGPILPIFRTQFSCTKYVHLVVQLSPSSVHQILFILKN